MELTGQDRKSASEAPTVSILSVTIAFSGVGERGCVSAPSAWGAYATPLAWGAYATPLARARGAYATPLAK